TGSDGKVTFRLPAGAYKFRADYQSSQYWTNEETLIAGQVNLLPWLGVRWLAAGKKGSKTGAWLAFLINFASWVSFGYAMYLRLWRNLPQFYTMITITTLLWATGILLYVYSRHACKDGKTSDKLDDA
ncbi:MAG: hypothetical protein SVP52_02400, partial [Chloroflexota bacterium]|nr:hypothetical protein [Chloroflexota bacterium]